MKTLIISFYFISFFSIGTNLFSQSGWTRQPVNTTRTLIGLYFLNNNTAWTVGDSGVICKTTNAGTNWVKTAYSGGGTLVSLYFKNELTGIIGGYEVSHLSGFIIRTTNGGSSWTRSNYSGEPYDLYSLGGDTVWCSRHDGYVMRSYDLGSSWMPTFIRQNLELYTIYFTNPMTGWTGGAVYGGSAYIYKTTNGGASWFNQFISTTDHFYCIYFINNQSGFASTLNGAIYGTTNGGTDWVRRLYGVSFALFRVRFPDINTGFTVGQNRTIMKTTNNGAFWYLQVLPLNISSSITFSNINFRTTTLGWAVGDSGIILKTTNSGELVGVQYLGNEIVEKYRLSQNYPNPFNPNTTIEFDIAKATHAILSIYDLTGKEIEVLIDQDLQRGSYRVNYNAFNLSSGVYCYKLKTNEFIETKKLVLLK